MEDKESIMREIRSLERQKEFHNKVHSYRVVARIEREIEELNNKLKNI